MGRIESGVRLVLAFNEALNRHDVDAMLGLVSDDCVMESADPAPDGTLYRGKPEIAAYWRALFRRAPHAQMQGEEVFGLGYRCMMRWKYSDGQPADGRSVRGVTLFQIRNNLLSDIRLYVKG